VGGSEAKKKDVLYIAFSVFGCFPAMEFKNKNKKLHQKIDQNPKPIFVDFCIAFLGVSR
jgi:hypothetical protein